MASEAPAKLSFKASLNVTNKPSKPSAASSAKPSPSPAPSQTSNSGAGKSDLKRKRQDASNVVYSQPADTGTGNNPHTQVNFAMRWLKEHGKPQKSTEVAGYLSKQEDDETWDIVAYILQHHPRISYDRAQGIYRYKPIHNINSEQQLLGNLQAQSTFKGLNVKELQDGWPKAEDGINKLEAKGKVLATRGKDDHARMVWPDDPSLRFTIDPEFQDIWHKIRIPAPDAVADALEQEGLTPANKTRHVKKAPKLQEQKKKKRTVKPGIKATNKHMEGMLRDYSHLRK